MQPYVGESSIKARDNHMPHIFSILMSRRWLALAGIGLFVGIVLIWVVADSSHPVVPSEYQDIGLGMTVQEVNAILEPGPFRQPNGPGYSGWQKDAQQTPECYALMTDSTQWNQRFRTVTWRESEWSMTLTYDANNLVAGKSLVLIDHNEFSFQRNPLLWIRRKLGRFRGPIP
jgi:hypothetical protein